MSYLLNPYILGGIVKKDLLLDINPEKNIFEPDSTNLIDPSTWTTGTGSVSGFGVNGSTAENNRYLGTDPWGNYRSLVWQAVPDSTSGADGGWNTSLFSVDQSKKYRFAVWVKRPVTGNGHFYFGTRGYNSSNSNIGVRYRDSTSTTTNPYFEVNVNWGEWGNNSDWYLAIGYVWPYGTGTGSNTSDAGMYTVNGTKVDSIERDYVWLNGTTQAVHRTYLFYTTNTSTRQEWIYPRVDVVDGTEPTISQLLSNFKNRVYDQSENGFVGYRGNYPTLTSNQGGSIYFDGNNDIINFSYSSSFDFSKEQTLCILMKPATGADNDRRNPYNQAYGGSGTITHEINGTFSYYFGTNGGNGQPYVGRGSTFTVEPNETAFIAVTRNQNTNTVKWYKNNTDTYTLDAGGYASTNNGSSPISIGQGYVKPTIGDIYRILVYNRELSESEILSNFNALRTRVGI